MAKNRKVLKWIGFSFLGLFGFLLLLAVLIPVFVDVDKFRPQIVGIANETIRGKLSLGKLSLSLWGQVKVKVDGFELLDAEGQKVVSASDVDFRMPFSSLLIGSPSLTFVMKQPQLFVVKSKKGLNVLSLVKSAEEKKASVAPTAPSSPPPAWAVAMIARARLGVVLSDAVLAYTDKLTDLQSKVDALQVRVKDLSLGRPTHIEVSAMLNTKLGKTLSVSGPAVLDAKIEPDFSMGEFRKVAISFKGDLDKVGIEYGALFKKAPGITMHAEGRLSATPAEAQIESLVARFHNAELKVEGGVKGFGGVESASPEIRFQAKSNSVAMAAWSALIPLLAQYELAGTASFQANASGPLNKLGYDADFSLSGLTAKSPMLKAQPTIHASARVVTDRVEKMEMQLKAPGNDLKVTGSVQSLSAPKAVLQIVSSGMDLDQLYAFPVKAKTSGEVAAPSAAGQPSTSGAAAADYDAMLDSLRKNAIAQVAELKGSMNIKFLKFMNVRMDGMESAFGLKNLVASVDRFKMGLFNGTVASSAEVQLRPLTPTYRFNGKVTTLDLRQAVASQFALFKNTLFGKAGFEIKGTGASFNPDQAKGSLQASGSFQVAEAQFTSLDIGKMVTEAVNKALEGLEGKIPQVKGKRLGAPGNTQSGYERVASSFSISKGIFSMPDFVAVSGAHKGIDVKGATTVALKDYKLNANWELVDTHNITHAREVTVDINGVKIDPLLAEPNQPVRFPVVVTGTLFSPSPSYTAVPEHFARVALGNVGRAAEAKVKAEVKARAEAELNKIGKQAAPAVQKAIQDLGKQFKF
jgi:hypothetical protein